MQNRYEEEIDKRRITIESHESTIKGLRKNVESLENVIIEQSSIIKTQEKQI